MNRKGKCHGKNGKQSGDESYYSSPNLIDFHHAIFPYYRLVKFVPFPYKKSFIDLTLLMTLLISPLLLDRSRWLDVGFVFCVFMDLDSVSVH